MLQGDDSRVGPAPVQNGVDFRTARAPRRRHSSDRDIQRRWLVAGICCLLLYVLAIALLVLVGPAPAPDTASVALHWHEAGGGPAPITSR